MTKGIEVRTNEMEIVEAIKYMYGMDSLKEANRTLEEGEYTRDEIYRAIAWYRSVGLPHAHRIDWIEREGMKNVTTDYQNKF